MSPLYRALVRAPIAPILLYRALVPQLVPNCSTWTSLYSEPTPPPRYMFKHVHYEASTVDKGASIGMLSCSKCVLTSKYTHHIRITQMPFIKKPFNYFHRRIFCMSTSYKNMVSATHDTFLMSVLVTASPLWLTPNSSPMLRLLE